MDKVKENILKWNHHQNILNSPDYLQVEVSLILPRCLSQYQIFNLYQKK